MTRLPLLLSVALATSASAQISYFTATLDGAQEVPPVTTSGRGWSIVRFDASSSQVRIFVHTENLTNVTAAHMHAAPSGVNGAVIVGLSSANGRDWSGTGTLSAANAAALLAGNTYVNAHTAANPGGEIRGQVVGAVATRLGAQLDGSQETPPNASTATGVGVAFLHEPDNRIVYTVRTQGLANVVAAHIHTGAAGVAGPVLEGITGGPTDYCGVTRRLSAAELAAAKADGLYFNIHTAAFPGGEIRGQIRVNVGDLRAEMLGANEVPPVVTNAFGSACLTINPDSTVTYRVTTAGLSATAGHIHRGAVGVNGPVVVPFVGGPTVFAGTSAAQTATALADARGGLWYANVHTAANPGGEIRGQVRVARLPTPFGGACANSNGSLSQIGSVGFPCLGASFDVTLSGAATTAPAVLTIGGNRDNALGLPLPLDLAVVGAAGCFLFHDLAASINLASDANGCAGFPLAVPLVPALRGGHLYAQWFFFDTSLRASNALDMELQ